MKTTRIFLSLALSLSSLTSALFFSNSSAVGSMSYSNTTKNFKLNHQAFRDVPNTKGIQIFTFASNPMAGGYVEINGQKVANYQVERAAKAPQAADSVTIGHFGSDANQATDGTNYYLVVSQADFKKLKDALRIILP